MLKVHRPLTFGLGLKSFKWEWRSQKLSKHCQMFGIDNDLVRESKRQGVLKKQKNCVVEKVVLEKTKDDGESVANLFISLNEMGSVMSSLIFKELVSILVLFNY